MNFRSDTNYNVNRDSSKVTGLVSRSKSDIPSYYVLRSSRTEAYNVYSNILVLLDEFGYQNNKIYKKCFSRRKQILDRDITRNRSMYGKDIKFNREEVVVDSDSIEKEIDKMISLIKSGISLDDGNKRPFDYLDYYNKIGLRTTILYSYVNSSDCEDFKTMFDSFVRNNSYNYEIAEEKVKGILAFRTKRGVEFDKCGLPIPDTGYVVSEEYKRMAYHYLLINNIPFNSAAFGCLIDRLLLGCLDSELIEEIYYTNKINEIAFVMSDLKNIDKSQKKDFDELLGRVQERIDYYAALNKKKYKSFLEDLTQTDKLNFNNPYHLAVSNIYGRYCSDSTDSASSQSDIRTVIEKEYYEYRPIVSEKIIDKTIGQKTNNNGKK